MRLRQSELDKVSVWRSESAGDKETGRGGGAAVHEFQPGQPLHTRRFEKQQNIEELKHVSRRVFLGSFYT